MRVAALVLAAGSSTRMGEVNKLTLEVEDVPLVCRAVDALYGTSVSEIIVVTGHDEAAVRAALGDRAVSFVHNERHAEGMGTSIAAGIAVVADADAALVCLGDMPDVPSVVIESLIATASESAAPLDVIVVPTHDGRRGHPVLFGAHHFPALRALEGDRGAREVLEREAAHVIEVGCDDPGVRRDVDTQDDLSR